MRLSLWANGRMISKRSSRRKTARAVWHHCGARVPRQRCPSLRNGRPSIRALAVGRNALNARCLVAQSMDRLTTFLG